jgi:ribosomal protein S18 acetylase RimI-like enzyme
MSSYARSTEQGQIDEAPGLMLVTSGIPYGVFNAALLTESFAGDAAAIDEAVRIASRNYRQRRLPWSCWTCEDHFQPDVRPRAGYIFTRLGLRLVAEHHGMLAHPVAPPERTLPAMDLRRVADDVTRRDFIRISSSVFCVPPRVADRVYGSERFWEGHMVGWVGYVNGKPVSTAATDCDASAVGVYSVATIAAYRGRGYGERVTRHALEAAMAASGHRQSILQSTAAGFPLYSRMGYRPATRFAVYVSE